jgi:hypothetical protein
VSCFAPRCRSLRLRARRPSTADEPAGTRPSGAASASRGDRLIPSAYGATRIPANCSVCSGNWTQPDATRDVRKVAPAGHRAAQMHGSTVSGYRSTLRSVVMHMDHTGRGSLTDLLELERDGRLDPITDVGVRETLRSRAQMHSTRCSGACSWRRSNRHLHSAPHRRLSSRRPRRRHGLADTGQGTLAHLHEQSVRRDQPGRHGGLRQPGAGHRRPPRSKAAFKAMRADLLPES